MATIAELIGAVQRKLVYPASLAARPQTIAETLVDVIDEKVTEANLGREPWFAARAVIDAVGGQAEYPLDNVAPNFDKARFLYTQDLTDARARRAPVEIVSPEELTIYHHGGDPQPDTPSYVAWLPGAEAAAFYYDTARGANSLELAPVPARARQYVLVYEVMTARADSPQANAFRFEQFRGYIADTAALRLLPHCQWEGFSEPENMLRRRELAGSAAAGHGLVADVARGDLMYFKWRHSNRNPNTLTAIGFGMRRW